MEEEDLEIEKIKPRMSETDKINENLKNFENKVIEQVVPDDIEKFDFAGLFMWIKQPIAFIWGLSLKT